ncbi:MAG: periplasmic heavy metal sensor, partial [Caulobacteraceae bacterium]
GGPARRPVLHAAALSLAPENRRRFNALLRTEGRGVQDANRRARALRAAVWDSFSAGVFDPARAEADLAQARALNAASRRTVEDGVVDFAAGLSAAERARFGEALRRSPQRTSPPPSRGAGFQPAPSKRQE